MGSCKTLRILTMACIFLLMVFPATLTEAAEREVSEWVILGLDVPNYVDGLCRKVPQSERNWIRHYKMEVRWERVQPAPEKFDWSYYDRQVQAMLDDGARSILLLVGGPVPAWARDPEAGEFARKAPPRDWRDWEEFCSKLALRYGEVVDFYEIWNEPGWDVDAQAYRRQGVYHFGGQVESDYIHLLRLAHSAIKRVDPTARVISGALINNYITECDRGWELYGHLFGDRVLLGRGVDIEVSSDGAVEARRSVTFTCRVAEGVPEETEGTGKESREWTFLQPRSLGAGERSFLVLENGGDRGNDVTLRIISGDEGVHDERLPIMPFSVCTVCLDAEDNGEGGGACGRWMEVLSEEPLRAKLLEYMGVGDDGLPTWVAGGKGTPFRLNASNEDYHLREKLVFYNPGEGEVKVRVGFRDEHSAYIEKDVSLAGGSISDVTVDRDIRYLYENALTPTERSLRIVADGPIAFRRYLELSYSGRWRGFRECPASPPPAQESVIPVLADEYGLQEHLEFINQDDEEIRVDLTFSVDGIRFREASAILPGRGRKSYDLREWLAVSEFCDMIAVHPYGLPEMWGPFYENLKGYLSALGVDDELVVTEIGWPNHADYDPQAYDERRQAEALRTGLDGLRNAGCRKVWIYKDMDEAPGRSWDKTYFGLFRFDGSPHPAWQEYKGRQANNPEYPELTAVPFRDVR